MWFEWNYEGLWEFLWGTTSRTIQKTSQDPWPAPENWLKILQMQQMQLRKKSNKMQQFDDSIKNSTQIAPRSGPSRHFVFGRGFVVGSCQDLLTWPGWAHWRRCWFRSEDLHWTVWHSGTDAGAKLFGDSNCIVFFMLCKGTSFALMAVQRVETSKAMTGSSCCDGPNVQRDCSRKLEAGSDPHMTNLWTCGKM